MGWTSRSASRSRTLPCSCSIPRTGERIRGSSATEPPSDGRTRPDQSAVGGRSVPASRWQRCAARRPIRPRCHQHAAHLPVGAGARGDPLIRRRWTGRSPAAIGAPVEVDDDGLFRVDRKRARLPISGGTPTTLRRPPRCPRPAERSPSAVRLRRSSRRPGRCGAVADTSAPCLIRNAFSSKVRRSSVRSRTASFGNASLNDRPCADRPIDLVCGEMVDEPQFEVTHPGERLNRAPHFLRHQEDEVGRTPEGRKAQGNRHPVVRRSRRPR